MHIPKFTMEWERKHDTLEAQNEIPEMRQFFFCLWKAFPSYWKANWMPFLHPMCAYSYVDAPYCTISVSSCGALLHCHLTCVKWIWVYLIKASIPSTLLTITRVLKYVAFNIAYAYYSRQVLMIWMSLLHRARRITSNKIWSKRPHHTQSMYTKN